MGKDGGQWEVEDEEGGQNGRGKQGEIRWQVVEERMDGRWRRRGGMRKRQEMDMDDRRNRETLRGQKKTKTGGQWRRMNEMGNG